MAPVLLELLLIMIIAAIPSVRRAEQFTRSHVFIVHACVHTAVGVLPCDDERMDAADYQPVSEKCLEIQDACITCARTGQYLVLRIQLAQYRQ